MARFANINVQESKSLLFFLCPLTLHVMHSAYQGMTGHISKAATGFALIFSANEERFTSACLVQAYIVVACTSLSLRIDMSSIQPEDGTEELLGIT
jgi:hypothetical protein